jgi:hypothetical protein
VFWSTDKRLTVSASGHTVSRFFFEKGEGMNNLEKNLVKVVAKASPWLAPIPSAYFVGQASMEHLAIPLPVAVVAALVIEFLGLSTVHSVLWLADYNANRRKIDPHAPTWIAGVLGVAYVVATVGLVVLLEVAPFLATYVPALFPVLAIVGVVNLALIAQQERREDAIETQKAEARERRWARRQARKPAQQVHKTITEPAQESAQEGAQNAVLDSINRTRRERRETLKRALLEAYRDDPEMGTTEAARVLGVHRNTVHGYARELQEQGRIRKNGRGWEVL